MVDELMEEEDVGGGNAFRDNELEDHGTRESRS